MLLQQQRQGRARSGPGSEGGAGRGGRVHSTGSKRVYRIIWAFFFSNTQHTHCTYPPPPSHSVGTVRCLFTYLFHSSQPLYRAFFK